MRAPTRCIRLDVPARDTRIGTRVERVRLLPRGLSLSLSLSLSFSLSLFEEFGSELLTWISESHVISQRSSRIIQLAERSRMLSKIYKSHRLLTSVPISRIARFSPVLLSAAAVKNKANPFQPHSTNFFSGLNSERQRGGSAR